MNGDKDKELPEKALHKEKQYGAMMDKNYLRHADGRPLWVLSETIAVTNTYNKQFYVKTVINVNNKKLPEEKLLKSNDLFEKMIQTVSDALFVVDENENILKMNRLLLTSLRLRMISMKAQWYLHFR